MSSPTGANPSPNCGRSAPGATPATRRDRLVTAFITDLGAWYVIEVMPAVTSLTRSLLTRYDLRAGDALQLASAIWLRQSVEVVGLQAFDTRLVGAAKAEHFAAPIPAGRS